MLESLAGIFGLVVFALAFALALRGLANVLRRRYVVRDAPPLPVGDASETSTISSSSSGRTFVVAIVGFVLYAGSFYFYLWGASANSTGLTGLMVMLSVGFCLMVAIFYAWSRGGPWSQADVFRDESAADLEGDGTRG